MQHRVRQQHGFSLFAPFVSSSARLGLVSGLARRWIAVSLSTFLALLSPGLECYEALAAESRAPSGGVVKIQSGFLAGSNGANLNYSPGAPLLLRDELRSVEISASRLEPPGLLEKTLRDISEAALDDAVGRKLLLPPGIETPTTDVTATSHPDISNGGTPAGFRRMLENLLKPGSVAGLNEKGSAPGASELRDAAEKDFSRLGGRASSYSSWDPIANSALENGLVSGRSRDAYAFAKPMLLEGAGGARRDNAPGPAPVRRYRSAVSPMMFAGALKGASMAAHAAAHWLVFHAGVSSALAVSSVVLGSAAWVFAVPAALELGVFIATMWRGRKMSEDQAREALAGHVKRLGAFAPAMASFLSRPGNVQIWRPNSPASSFAFTEGAIFIRKETLSVPWVAYAVLKHELKHVRDDLARGPPRGREPFWRRLIGFLWGETVARVLDYVPDPYLKYFLRTPLLERVERDAGVSLEPAGPADVLVVRPSAGKLAKSSVISRFTRGRARIFKFKPADGDSLQKYLHQESNHGRFRSILLSEASGWTSDPATEAGKRERLRLDLALKHLDAAHALFRRIQASGRMPAAGSPLAKEFERLMGKNPPGRKYGRAPYGGYDEGSPRAPGRRDLFEEGFKLSARRNNVRKMGQGRGGELSAEEMDRDLSSLWHATVSTHLKGVRLIEIIDGIYESLQDRGTALVSWEQSGAGLDVVEKLFNYWRAGDSGKFDVRRLDLPEGGHVLAAMKQEPMVEMWLKPLNPRGLKKSYVNISGDPMAAGSPGLILNDAGFSKDEIKQFETKGLDGQGGFNGPQEAVLLAAGFTKQQILRFRMARVEVLHAFEENLRRGNSVYVRLPRIQSKILERYAQQEKIDGRESFSLSSEERTISPKLIDSAPLQNVTAVWKTDIVGKASGMTVKAYVADTPRDRRHMTFAGQDTSEDKNFTNSPPGDDVHGTHTASTIGGNPAAQGAIPVHKGLAYFVKTVVHTVFPGQGEASDGPIEASGVDAVNRSGDVHSFSGSGPGYADGSLAEDFSNLARRKNPAGFSTAFTASASNEGPWDFSVGEPSSGRYVTSVGAVTKSADDGRPEIAFYSSIGPSIFASLRRTFGLKRFAWKPEDVAVGGDAGNKPGKDLFPDGVEAARSSSAPADPSDTPDGLWTRMSGTSMSNPMVAGIILLVKVAVWATADKKSEAYRFYQDNTSFALKMILMQSARDLGVPNFAQGAGFVDAWAAVQLAVATFGAKPTKQFPDAGTKGFEWLRRAKAVWDAEDGVYDGAVAAAKDAMRGNQAFQDLLRDGFAKDDAKLRKTRLQAAKKAWPSAQEKFKELGAAAVPGLVQALDAQKSPEWIVRAYAAFALLNLILNFENPTAIQALARAAVGDPDARVRQTAFMALGFADPNEKIDPQIRTAIGEAVASLGADPGRPADIGLYRAFALARHGDASGFPLLLGALHDADKAVRYTAVWLLGYLSPPDARAADVLADKVVEEGERGNIRHRAIVSIANALMLDDPSKVGDRAIWDVIRMAGPEQALPSLNSTIAEFLANVQANRKVVQRLREGSLRDSLTRFVMEHRAWAGSEGSLGRIESSLAFIMGIPLNSLGPSPNPGGHAVPGVDPVMGPVDVIVEMPEGASSAGLDAATLARHHAELRASLRGLNALWVSLPDHQVAAFSNEMARRGFKSRRASAQFNLIRPAEALSALRAAREGGAAPASRVILIAGDEEARELAANPIPGVEVMAVVGPHGVSEAAVLAALEFVERSVADPLGSPVLVAMDHLAGPAEPEKSLVSAVLERLALKNIVVARPAGILEPR